MTNAGLGNDTARAHKCDKDEGSINIELRVMETAYLTIYYVEYGVFLKEISKRKHSLLRLCFGHIEYFYFNFSKMSVSAKPFWVGSTFILISIISTANHCSVSV